MPKTLAAPRRERVRSLILLRAQPTRLPPRLTALSAGMRGSLAGPTAVWAALWINTLTYQASFPLPGPVGQLITQGALPVALFLALLANPAMLIRPNIVLGLMTLMGVEAFLSSIHNEFVISSTYRAIRLTMFLIVLWLLTPWWGDAQMRLLRAHLAVLRVITGVVVVGALAWPTAHGQTGRLQGWIWPIPPPQVAHYAAMLLGITAVMWFTGTIRRRPMIITLVVCLYVLIDSQTRTAVAGAIVAMILAGASLFFRHARVRRTAAVVTATVVGMAVFFAPIVIAWASRGQDAEDASQLTGRTKVWTQVVNLDRPTLNQVFGNGLSNKSFDGLPIDSNWIATYLDLGFFGAAVIAAFLLVILLSALTRVPGPRRAVALFVFGYCLVASFTEVGLGDASPYMLDVVVAASVLARRPPSIEKTKMSDTSHRTERTAAGRR